MNALQEQPVDPAVTRDAQLMAWAASHQPIKKMITAKGLLTALITQKGQFKPSPLAEQWHLQFGSVTLVAYWRSAMQYGDVLAHCEDDTRELSESDCLLWLALGWGL